MILVSPILLIGTSNPNKVLRWSMALPDIRVLAPSDVGVRLDVPEGMVSIIDNARAKALAYARRTGLVTLGEDAGLRIRAIDGAPGLALRRWGGEVKADLSDEALLEHLLVSLKGVDDTSATFDVAVAVASPQGYLWTGSFESHGFFDLGRLGTDYPVGNPLSALFVSRETGRPWAEMMHLEERPSHNRAFVERVRQAIDAARAAMGRP
jgi:XTP/dITP diphosphohydrolase